MAVYRTADSVHVRIAGPILRKTEKAVAMLAWLAEQKNLAEA